MLQVTLNRLKKSSSGYPILRLIYRWLYLNPWLSGNLLVVINILGQCIVGLTDGPGAGKTTVLHALKKLGYSIAEESARAIIQERLHHNLPPRPSPREFAIKIMHRDITNYRSIEAATECIFFDRGLPDALCMLDQVATLGQRKVTALNGRYAYHQQVLVFPPWEEIYCRDAERDQTIFDAIQTFETLSEWYRRSNYTIVEVPKAGVAERCDFVLQILGLD